jgi:hypothetical protein
MLAAVLLTGNAFAETRGLYHPDDLTVFKKDIYLSRRADPLRDNVAPPNEIAIGHVAGVAIDPLLSANIKKWFNNAPNALKQKIWTPRVDVVVVNGADELKTLFASHGHSTALASGSFMGFALIGNNQVPVIVFVQPTMLKASPEYQEKGVIHEMMHIYDLLDKRSKASAFVSAFKADMADINTRPLFVDTDKWFPTFYYYFTKPQEAFAEAGARLIRHAQSTPDDFSRLFPRVTTYVQDLLRKDRII